MKPESLSLSPWKVLRSFRENAPNYYTVTPVLTTWPMRAVALCDSKADADFIAHACNHHAELVAAVRGLITVSQGRQASAAARALLARIDAS